MNSQEIEGVVVGVLRDVQSMSGHAWTDIGPDSKPIGDLDSFESILGVEATGLIEEKLGCKFKIDSLFVSSGPKSPLSLRGIVGRIEELMKKP